MKQKFTLLILATAVVFLFAACTSAPEPAASDATSSGELTVSNVQANLALPSNTGSVWLEINNGTDTADVLVGAEVPGCGLVELHDMMMEDDVMIMQEVEGGEIAIPAGETVVLKRGGLHIMCMQKEAPLEEGSNVDIVLNFANAGAIEVTAPVVAPTSGMDHGDDDMDHGDMDHDEMDHDNHDG